MLEMLSRSGSIYMETDLAVLGSSYIPCFIGRGHVFGWLQPAGLQPRSHHWNSGCQRLKHQSSNPRCNTHNHQSHWFLHKRPTISYSPVHFLHPVFKSLMQWFTDDVQTFSHFPYCGNPVTLSLSLCPSCPIRGTVGQEYSQEGLSNKMLNPHITSSKPWTTIKPPLKNTHTVNCIKKYCLHPAFI